MNYKVIYDVGDETGWFLLDPILLIALAWVVAYFLFTFAVHGWLTRAVEQPPERVRRVMVRLGAFGCLTCGVLLVCWVVGYMRGGPMNYPVGRIAWLFPSVIVLLAGRHTLRHPTPDPPLVLSTLMRLGLLAGAGVVVTASTLGAWLVYEGLRERQAALVSGEATVLEGEVTKVYRVKQGPRVQVAGQTFHVEGRPCGHLGREVRLEPGMRVRVTHRAGAVLRFEVATKAEPPAAADGRRMFAFWGV